MKRSVAIAVALGIAAAAGGAFVAQRHGASNGSDPSNTPDRATVAAFYQQKLPDAQGVVRDLAGYRGQVVVVNFWATWCVPCVKEIPAFSKAHERAQGRVAFVGLGIDSPSAIAAFVDRFHPSYPLLVAGSTGTELARSFGDDAGALPFTLMLDGAGRVVRSKLGTVDEEEMSRWLAPYLGDHKS